MRRLFIFLVFVSPFMLAQVLISTDENTSSPHEDAILHLKAEKGTLIIPANTTQSVDEIKNNQPVAGMILFDKEKKQFLGYTGERWDVLNLTPAEDETPPVVGEVIFSEFMIDPDGDEKSREWFEVYNTTPNPLNLKNCTFKNNSYAFEVNGDLTIPQNGFLVFGSTKDMNLNNNVAVDYAYGFGAITSNFNFANTGANNVSITCNNVLIDKIDNLKKGVYPIEGGLSTALLPSKFNSTANDSAENFFSTGQITPGSINLLPTPITANEVRINEFHYKKADASNVEFVEVRADKNLNISSLKVYHYNGNNGEIIGSGKSLTGMNKTSDATYDYYVWEEIFQNGPDGFALVNGSDVLEFISYGGDVIATNGPASGETSVDVGLVENASLTISISRNSSGGWVIADPSTKGAAND